MTSLTFDIYLRSTPERVRAVLADPGKVPSERFGMSSHNDWDARHQFPSRTAEDETDSESAPGPRLTCEWLQTDIFNVGRRGGGSVPAHARPSSMKVRVSSSR